MLYIDKNLEVRGLVYAYDYFNTKNIFLRKTSKRYLEHCRLLGLKHRVRLQLGSRDISR